ncbi:MAG: hypothetical protein NUV75_07820 [Gallionella sp.]|nr:hypothetical protein [Gallionella sp.]
MNEELIADAELGEESRKFIESDLGRCVLGMAAQEVLLAQEKLGDVPPSDTAAIIELQNRVKVGKWFEQWLVELLQQGEQALEIFRHEKEQQ